MPIPRNQRNKKKSKSSSKKGDKENTTNVVISEKAKAEAQKFKQLGNDCFTKQDWSGAMDNFSQAIANDPTDHVFYSNRSAAALNMKNYTQAIADSEKCVEIKSDWAKGYSRLGAALFASIQASFGVSGDLKDAKLRDDASDGLDLAIEACEKGLEIDPDNAPLKTTKGQCEALVKKIEEYEEKIEEKKGEEEVIKQQSESKTTNKERGGGIEPVIGIDLGTTYSCVGVWQDEQVQIVEDESGNRTVPSYVAWLESGERVVGHRAKNQAAKNLENTVFDVKRFLGQRLTEFAVQEEVKRMPYKIIDIGNSKPAIEMTLQAAKKCYNPEEISAMVLGKMKDMAEAKLGRSVKKAVVTVPAYFNDAQRNATKAAGAIAGLDVLRIINEPTAAALAYGLDQKASKSGTSDPLGMAVASSSVLSNDEKKPSNVLIFDLGGGTFDVSILRLEDGIFEVIATGGDTHLGGEDFDNDFVNWLSSELKRQKKVDISDDKKALRRLKAAAEKAKRELSSGVVTKVDISVQGEDYIIDASRAKFESITQHWFDKTLITVKQVMKDAKLENKDIDDIVLVGGSTRIPKIQSMLTDYFGGKTLSKSINPDEAVAYGATVQAAILGGIQSNVCQDLLLVDVTPLSLGIETEGKNMAIVINRNTSIPCHRTDTFTTTEDYQDSINIRIFEGERPRTDGNHLLGEFDIKNIERGKAGVPQIEVTFALDANGILAVSARDKATNARANIQISNACKGLSSEQIEEMLRDAEKHKVEDELFRKKIEARNELEQMAFDVADRCPDDNKKREARDILEWLDHNQNLSIEEIATKKVELEKFYS